MPVLNDPKREVFAQAMARGASWREAGLQAGYKHICDQRAKAREELPAVAARIEELRNQAEWGEAMDIKPIFDLAMKLADKALTQDSAAAMTAAKGLLAEAARIKQALPRPASAAEPAGPTLPDLSKEEWLAAFAPKR